tara:strand:- start:30 stop:773 length:744 start_codon:yes stop_codon:yes gene_type:complete
MKKQNSPLNILMITLVILSMVSCNKDEQPTPNNPLNGRTTAVFNPDKSYGSMTDIDGNIYKTIKIGNQTWMAENLRVTKYNNGDAIPNIVDNEKWASLTTGAFCNYNNTSDLDTIATYGRLYNWYAVADTRGIAPEGWRVPTVADWNELIDLLGGDTIASNALKEVGIYHWEDPYESSNSSGFTAMPSGWRYLSESFTSIGFYSDYWTVTEASLTHAAFLYLYFHSSRVNKGINYKPNGYAVRLIKE